MFIVHVCIVLLILQCYMPPFVHFFSEHVKGIVSKSLWISWS